MLNELAMNLLTGVELYAYRLRACLPSPVVAELEREMEYLCPEERTGKICMDIAGFSATESMEETLIRWLERICFQKKSFEVQLNNFGSTPEGIVYAGVNGFPFYDLQAQFGIISSYISSCSCPPLRMVKNPVIIFGKLNNGNMYGTMNYYSKRLFSATFIMNEIALVKEEDLSERTISYFRLLP